MPEPLAPDQATPRGLLDPTLYRELLGPSWNDLARCLQSFHGTDSPLFGSGLFEIRRGTTRLARFLAWTFRLPKEGDAIPTRVVIRRSTVKNGPVEIWERTFGGKKLITVQYIRADVLVERFGMIELWYRLSVADHKLVFEPAGAAFVLAGLRMLLPSWLAPRIEATVSRSERFANSFEVSVKLVAPMAGFILAYQGSIEPGRATP